MTIVVAAAIVRREGRILITRRRKNSHLGGMWEFPGGKVEAGETLVAALVRELGEELGVAVRVGAEIFHAEHEYPDRTVRLHFFECEIISGEPRALFAEELRWIAPEELPSFEFPPADRDLIARLTSK